MKRLVASIILALFMTFGVVLIAGCLPPAPKPVTPTPAPLPPPVQEKPPTGIIKDLAYVKGMVSVYSDDADPEPEGIQIVFLWYDTKSEWIIFRNITISVDIELYQRGFDFKTGQYLLGRCIYKGQAQIDSSLASIRIPFEDINATYIPGFRYGSLAKLTIHTPKQGDYSVEAFITADFGFD